MQNISKFYFIIIPFLLFHTSIYASDISLQLSNSNKGFSLYRSGKKLVEIENIQFDFRNADSVKVISKSGQQIALLTYYPWINPRGTEETVQKQDTLWINIETDFIHVFAAPKWARQVQIVLKDLGGNYYGLLETLYPDNKKSPNLRRATIDVEIQPESYRYHENCASVHSAFFFNSLGYASFFDSFSSGQYRLAQEGKTILMHNTGKLNWYIFTGNYKTIYNDYYSIIGTPKYVPDWFCGPVIWRDENTGSKQILDDAKQFTDLQIPITAMFVDRPYSDGANGWSKMDFSDHYSHPEKWISELNNKYGVEFMTWVASATFGDKDFPGLLAGKMCYFDLTNKDAVAEFHRRLENNQYKYGVKGHKLDRADETFPLPEDWADKTDDYSKRNKYPYLYARVTDSLLNQAWGRDNASFARAAYQRSQPYLTAVWGGDVRANWDGLASNIANATRCSFMGFPDWGTDVGGYLGEGYISPELYTRWLQFGSWTGFYEIKLDGSGGRGRERTPWQYDEAFQKRYAQILTERMKLIPYIYSMLNNSAETGPLMKPMAMVYPEDKRFTNTWDQYIFGDAFLVAPVYSAQNRRKVILPEGNWYDFYSHKKYTGGQTIKVTKSMEEFPVFMKAGSIHAEGQFIAGNSKNWQKTKNYVDLYVVAGGSCSFDLLDPASNTKTHIRVIKSGDKNYEVHIPANALIQNLYVISSDKLSRVKKNGKKNKFEEAGTASYCIKNVSDSSLVLTFE